MPSRIARVVPNPDGTTPAGLNKALEAATGEIVVRFDAHAEMPAGYIASCLTALAQEAGAVNVGGWRQVEATGPWGRATGAALASKLGVGNPRMWRRPAPGEGRRDVDTVPLGCWPAHALREIGGWDERFIRNQDFELNHRLRRSSGRVVFDPEIWSIYHPRESLRTLARQYWEYGQFKARLLKREPTSVRPRQLAPVGLAAVAVFAVVPTGLASPARVALGVYGVSLVSVGLRSKTGWRTAPVIATMHASWFAGLVAGMFTGQGRD